MSAQPATPLTVLRPGSSRRFISPAHPVWRRANTADSASESASPSASRISCPMCSHTAAGGGLPPEGDGGGEGPNSSTAADAPLPCDGAAARDGKRPVNHRRCRRSARKKSSHPCIACTIARLTSGKVGSCRSIPPRAWAPRDAASAPVRMRTRNPGVWLAVSRESEIGQTGFRSHSVRHAIARNWSQQSRCVTSDSL